MGDPSLAERLRRSRQPLLLMLDFDGTLVDIAATPDAIVVPDGAAERLRALASRGHLVWIVSGRSRQFLVDRLGVGDDDSVGVIGLHGAEWPGEPLPLRDARLDTGVTAVRAATAKILGDRDLLVEDKGLSVAFHTRQLVGDDDHDDVVDTIAAALAPLAGDGLSVLRGHEVLELRPTMASKARAAQRLIQSAPHATPVFVGDDVTDEEAFAVVGDAGVTVRVSANPAVVTVAAAIVEGPAAVWAALESLGEG